MFKYKIIANPGANRGAARQRIPEIETELINHNLNFDIVQTGYPLHATDIARQAAADDYDVIVAAGGDGTSNEVLNGLMLAKHDTGKQPVMGILTAGSGNDFAYSMGIPDRLDEGVSILAKAERRTIDVGLVRTDLNPEGRYFGNAIGIGFDAVGSLVADKYKRLPGFISYLLASFETIFFHFNAPEMKIELDDETITQRALMVSIMNGTRIGGGFLVAPEGNPDDGLLDLCIVGSVSRPRAIQILFQVTGGKHYGSKDVKGRQTRTLIVTAIDGTLPAHIDGDSLCTEGHQISVELLPRQLDIIYQPAS